MWTKKVQFIVIIGFLLNHALLLHKAQATIACDPMTLKQLEHFRLTALISLQLAKGEEKRTQQFQIHPVASASASSSYEGCEIDVDPSAAPLLIDNGNGSKKMLPLICRKVVIQLDRANCSLQITTRGYSENLLNHTLLSPSEGLNNLKPEIKKIIDQTLIDQYTAIDGTKVSEEQHNKTYSFRIFSTYTYKTSPTFESISVLTEADLNYDFIIQMARCASVDCSDAGLSKAYPNEYDTVFKLSSLSVYSSYFPEN